MIPFYSYSPDNVDPGPGSSSNSYFQPTTHISAHSFDSIPLAPTETPIPTDTHTYSHSAPATPHPAFDPLRPHQVSYTTSSFYQPQYFGTGDSVTGDSTLIGFDQVTAASSSTSSVLGRSEDAARSLSTPCAPRPVVSPRPLSLHRQRRSVDEESDSGLGADRKSRGQRGRAKRHGVSPTARPEGPRPVLPTRRSIPDSITEEQTVEKAEKSCKACR